MTNKKDKGYNGWPNRETWNVMLWLDNDEPAYRSYTSTVKQRLATKMPVFGRDAQVIAANALGAKTGDGISLSDPKIRWGAIAKAMRESLD